eukprot:5502017-Amphidinium_carterae.2
MELVLQLCNKYSKADTVTPSSPSKLPAAPSSPVTWLATPSIPLDSPNLYRKFLSTSRKANLEDQTAAWQPQVAKSEERRSTVWVSKQRL